MNEYASLAELRTALNINAATDTADDPFLSMALEAASRAIDNFTGRFFYKGPLAQQRFYESDNDLIVTDDIMSPPNEVVIAFASTAGSYVESSVNLRLYPANAPANGEPFTHLRPDKATYTYPVKEGVLVRITAQYGWPAVPPEVRQATLIQALRFAQRRHAPFGVAGSPEVGSEVRLLSRLDPDVEALVRPYVRSWYVA